MTQGKPLPLGLCLKSDMSGLNSDTWQSIGLPPGKIRSQVAQTSFFCEKTLLLASRGKNVLELRTTSMENIVSKSSHYTACPASQKNEVLNENITGSPSVWPGLTLRCHHPRPRSHCYSAPEGAPPCTCISASAHDPKTFQNLLGTSFFSELPTHYFPNWNVNFLRKR